MKRDKINHLAISAFLCLFFSFVLGFEMAVIATLLIGVGWELFWKVKKNNPFSWQDVIADWTGIIIGLMIFSLLKVLL